MIWRKSVGAAVGRQRVLETPELTQRRGEFDQHPEVVGAQRRGRLPGRHGRLVILLTAERCREGDLRLERLWRDFGGATQGRDRTGDIAQIE